MRITTFAATLLAAVLPASAAAQAAAVGLGEVHTVPSTVLGESRHVFVHAPPGCESGGTSRCAVLVTLDGEMQFAHTVTTTAFLHRNGLVPPLLVVGVGTTARTRDLTPTVEPQTPGSGGGERFLDFVERELLPWIDGRFPTHPMKVFAGHSFGGLTVLHALAKRPHLFQGWIAVAPTLLWNDGEPARNLRASFGDKATRRHSLYVATAQEGAGLERAASDLRKLLKDRAPSGLRWTIEHFPAEDHGSVVLPAHVQGLRWVFDGWGPPRDPRTGGLALQTFGALEKHYREVSERFGFEVVPLEPVANLYGYTALRQGDTREAIRIFEWNARRYPASANVHDSLGEALEAAGRLEDARAQYQAAVEKGAARRDPNLRAYEEHLRAVEKKLARP